MPSQSQYGLETRVTVLAHVMSFQSMINSNGYNFRTFGLTTIPSFLGRLHIWDH